MQGNEADPETPIATGLIPVKGGLEERVLCRKESLHRHECRGGSGLLRLATGKQDRWWMVREGGKTRIAFAGPKRRLSVPVGELDWLARRWQRVLRPQWATLERRHIMEPE